MSGHYISSADWPDFAALLRAWRSGELRRPRGPGGGERAGFSQHQLVVLYGDLHSGGTVQAEVLRRERQLQVQDVAVLGWPIGLDQRTIALRWEGTPLPAIGLESTREQVWKALQGSAIAEVLLDVTLGTREDVAGDIHPGRWRIHLAPRPDGEDWPLLQLHAHDLGPAATVVVTRNPHVGTGRLIEVHSVLPTGHPTPLRRGAQCAVALFPGCGWGVIAAEMRKYPDGNFGGLNAPDAGGDDEEDSEE